MKMSRRRRRRRLTGLGCLIAVVLSLGACGSGETKAIVEAGDRGSSTSGTAPSGLQSVSDHYLALADEMNGQMDQLKNDAATLHETDPGFIDAAKRLLTRQAATIREFDTRLATIAFPADLGLESSSPSLPSD